MRGTKLLNLNALYELAWEIQLAIAQLFMLNPQIFLLIWCVDSNGLCSHNTNRVQIFPAIHIILIAWGFGTCYKFYTFISFYKLDTFFMHLTLLIEKHETHEFLLLWKMELGLRHSGNGQGLTVSPQGQTYTRRNVLIFSQTRQRSS